MLRLIASRHDDDDDDDDDDQRSFAVTRLQNNERKATLFIEMNNYFNYCICIDDVHILVCM